MADVSLFRGSNMAAVTSQSGHASRANFAFKSKQPFQITLINRFQV